MLYLIIKYFKKLNNLFYKNHPNKPTAIFKAIDTAKPLVRQTIMLAIKLIAPKQKQSYLINNTNK